jgi:hypothetical protein
MGKKISANNFLCYAAQLIPKNKIIWVFDVMLQKYLSIHPNFIKHNCLFFLLSLYFWMFPFPRKLYD